MCGDRVLTESSSVMVAFDFETQQTVPMPDEWRERLARYLNEK
jgi:acyl-CoA thioesterase FadM